MARGVVKWFDEIKSYGFITPESGKDIFFHRSDLNTLEGTIEKGAQVEFEIGEGPKGPQARKITPIPQEEE
jgi:cold shock protein